MEVTDRQGQKRSAEGEHEDEIPPDQGWKRKVEGEHSEDAMHLDGHDTPIFVRDILMMNWEDGENRCLVGVRR